MNILSKTFRETRVSHRDSGPSTSRTESYLDSKGMLGRARKATVASAVWAETQAAEVP